MKSLPRYISENITEAGSTFAAVNAGYSGINIMSDTEGLINKLMSKAELNKPYSKAYREKMTHAVEDMIFSVTAAYKKGKLLASDIPYQLKLSYSKALRQHGVDPEDLIKIAVGFGKFDKETREIFARAKFNVDELPECLK